MTQKQNDGGPAFPATGGRGPLGAIQPESGMSLRDWFAGQAIYSVAIASVGLDSGEIDELARRTAIDAYKFADAMLSARHEHEG